MDRRPEGRTKDKARPCPPTGRTQDRSDSRSIYEKRASINPDRLKRPKEPKRLGY